MSLSSTLCDYFAAAGFDGCKLYQLESRIEHFARTGEGEFPPEITAMVFDHKALGLRTGFHDYFEIEADGLEGKRTLSLSAETVRALVHRGVPGFVSDALQKCLEDHGPEAMAAALSDRPRPNA